MAMTHGDIAVSRELKLIGTELKMLGTSAMVAVQANNAEALNPIIQRRDEVLAQLRMIAQTYPDAVKNCAELIEASEQEAQFLSIASIRRDALQEELQSIHQRINLRHAYSE